MDGPQTSLDDIDDSRYAEFEKSKNRLPMLRRCTTAVAGVSSPGSSTARPFFAIIGGQLLQLDFLTESWPAEEFLDILNRSEGSHKTIEDVDATMESVFIRFHYRRPKWFDFPQIAHKAIKALVDGTPLQEAMNALSSFAATKSPLTHPTVDCELCDEGIHQDVEPLQEHLKNHPNAECTLMCTACNVLILTKDEAIYHVNCVRSYAEVPARYVRSEPRGKKIDDCVARFTGFS